ncbi:2239_t:CDS:2 [Funneliformis geosporum]|uniref:5810_t:CDS:1 n=1 Tax=Funneliformis geosporum TaxID=1117311 RepID=A0A9W4SMJ9_9GLOM|nr:2239_t:CDS:2 [Funneliformis geosporum]CAI2173745.1 5810_t:CDS:2 [Funneliformis geosporum]
MSNQVQQKENHENLFQEIGQVVDDDDAKPTEIESYCVNCSENGITKLLLTRIPHWRDIVIMSFNCEHCGFNNNEVQFAGAISEKGCTCTFTINNKQDLNRQLVKSETASIKLDEIDLEIPATAKRGCLTTIEGVISSIIEDLSAEQPNRKHQDVVTYEKIEIIIQKLSGYLENKEPFTITVDDPAGNSYIENLCAPNPDSKLHIRHYVRTRDMEISLGLNVPDEQKDDLEKSNSSSDDDDLPEVMKFPANCSHCNVPCDTKMQIINIPHFKEVVIMATTCDACGYKSNEVKSSGGISPLGKKISLKIEDLEDMSRDVLKSETCSLSIPEVELELMGGTLGGRFTTVEGLLRQIHDELKDKSPFSVGDSIQDERKFAFQKFIDKLNKVMSGEALPITLILDDPLGNSYLQNPYAPDSDPNMIIEQYERTWEQNEFLGLNDMVLENYGDSNN